MSLSHAYGVPPTPDQGARLLNAALDLGYDHLDTAALYGFGKNEALIGESIAHRRDDYFLASKCGMTGVDGKRVIDGRPQTLRRTIDESLSRLRTDRIDLYYLHRWDKGGADRGVGRRAVAHGGGEQDPVDRTVRSLRCDAAARACGASDRGGAERIFAVVAQCGAGRAGGDARTGNDIGRLLPGRARVPGRWWTAI
jgi:aryl-alcohol dehydrogenase-like predicted oxidoreductase